MHEPDLDAGGNDADSYLRQAGMHAYSFTTHGTPVTMYVGRDFLPVESVVKDSDYNSPIDISP